MHKPVGQKELARAVGVGRSTVAHALAGTGTLSPATRKRIVSIADEMGYRADQFARGLVTGRRHIAGFVCPGEIVKDEWFTGVLSGAIERFESSGFHTILFQGKPEASPTPEFALKQLVDGMLLVLGWSAAFHDEVVRRGIPIVVAVPGEDVDCDVVRPDDEAAGRMATEHLIGLGHRRIAYFQTGPSCVRRIQERRRRGYTRAMRAAGLTPLLVPGKPIPHSAFRSPDVYDDLLCRILARSLGSTPGSRKATERPSALLCCADTSAGTAMRWLHMQGFDMPRQVSVMGFEDVSYGRAGFPSLSTVHMPWKEIGSTAAQMLFERIENPAAPRREIVLPVSLVARESTAAPE